MTWMLENRTIVSLFALLASLILVPVDATCAQRPGDALSRGNGSTIKKPRPPSTGASTGGWN